MFDGNIPWKGLKIAPFADRVTEKWLGGDGHTVWSKNFPVDAGFISAVISIFQLFENRKLDIPTGPIIVKFGAFDIFKHKSFWPIEAKGWKCPSELGCNCRVPPSLSTDTDGEKRACTLILPQGLRSRCLLSLIYSIQFSSDNVTHSCNRYDLPQFCSATILHPPRTRPSNKWSRFALFLPSFCLSWGVGCQADTWSVLHDARTQSDNAERKKKFKIL